MRQLKITKQVTNRETASLDKYLQEIGKVDLITAEMEVELAQRIKAGDQIALEKLFMKECDKIIITRPTVSKEEIGFLPGDLREKMDPWVQPIYQNMYMLYDKVKIEQLITGGQIEIVPVSFMRGRNFTDCLVVVDEAQNLTDNQTELLLTRICHGSKMIFCGDAAQVDLRDKKTSGFDVVCKHMKEVPGFEVVTLEKNHRHEIVEYILDIY